MTAGEVQGAEHFLDKRLRLVGVGNGAEIFLWGVWGRGGWEEEDSGGDVDDGAILAEKGGE